MATLRIRLELDSPNRQLLLRLTDPTTGNTAADTPTATLKLDSLRGTDGNYHSVAFRELCVITSGPGVTPVTYQTIIALCSEPYNVS